MWARKLHEEWSKDCESNQRKTERDKEEESKTQLGLNTQLWIMQKMETRDR